MAIRSLEHERLRATAILGALAARHPLEASGEVSPLDDLRERLARLEQEHALEEWLAPDPCAQG
jgi:hypothetical protein